MGILDKFKQADADTVVVGAAIILAGAAVGSCVALTINAAAQQKRLAALEEAARLNAGLTLGLSNIVAHQMKLGENQ